MHLRFEISSAQTTGRMSRGFRVQASPRNVTAYPHSPTLSLSLCLYSSYYPYIQSSRLLESSLLILEYPSCPHLKLINYLSAP